MERITLQIRGLPQEVDVDKAHQYFVRLRNDEAYPVTVVFVVIGDKYTLEPIWPEDRSRLAGVTVDVGIIEFVQIDW